MTKKSTKTQSEKKNVKTKKDSKKNTKTKKILSVENDSENTKETDKINSLTKDDVISEDKINEIQNLTDQQKKTIWEWTKYLSKALLTAILKKLLGQA